MGGVQREERGRERREGGDEFVVDRGLVGGLEQKARERGRGKGNGRRGWAGTPLGLWTTFSPMGEDAPTRTCLDLAWNAWVEPYTSTQPLVTPTDSNSPTQSSTSLSSCWVSVTAFSGKCHTLHPVNGSMSAKCKRRGSKKGNPWSGPLALGALRPFRTAQKQRATKRRAQIR